MTVPVEKPYEGPINYFSENWWVDYGLPEGGRREDRFTTEEEEEECRPEKYVNGDTIKEGAVTYDAFINPSTIGTARPAGARAGARAINTLTFSFN